MNKSIEDLIREIDRRVEDKVLQTSEGELLKKLIRNADNFDEAMNIARMGNVYKRTGLHFTPRIEKPTDKISYFKKNETLSFKDENSKVTHKLIIGENYDALRNLLIQYRNGIDVIYIDPPYAKDKMGQFAKTNYENAISRDNLLSMMYSRLLLAKQLMSKDGVIFCSIDDKNQAYLKCLFDDVFEERNCVMCFPKKGTGGKGGSNHFAKVHEYLLCYARNIDLYKSGRVEKFEKYKYFDEDKQLYYNTQLLRKWGDESRRSDRESMFYPIYYNILTNKFALEREDDSDLEIYPMIDPDNEGRWRWYRQTMKKNLDLGLVELQKNKKGELIPYERLYENPEGKDTKLYSSWIEDIDNSTGKTLLKGIIPQDSFDYPKAVDLIIKVLRMATNNENAVILDFFAGTGTTGNAVLDMNRSYGGNRTFILCQLNEVDAKNPDGIAYNTTTKRLKRIMTGECYDGSTDFEWIKDNKPYGGSLDVYELDYVSDKEYEDGKTAFEVIDETLYGKEKFTSVKEKIDWVCQNFQTTQKQVENDQEWETRERGAAE